MINAKDIPLSQAASALPDVSGAINMLLQPVKVGIITKTQVEGLIDESVKWHDTKVVRQPFSAQQLMIRPEGQRSWKWFSIHATPDLILGVDDLFILYDVRYRVMEKYDFSEYGFLYYNCVEDFTTKENL